jgi:signal transduction histidine kinase
MRFLVYELRPLALEQAGLAEALQYRLDAVEKRAGVDAQLRVSLDTDLAPAVENGLYRIAQEALNNALKHAEATTISVALRTANGNVELEITDNGKGFQPEAIRDQGGMGMVSIRERVATLGGEYSITSKPDEGTRVWISAPLNPSA